MNIKIKKVLTSVVESFLPRFCDKKLGLLIMIDCSYDNYEKDVSVRFPLYYLIHRPSNYTKVLFLDVIKNKDFRCPPSYYDVIKKQGLPWILKSNHDSCWGEDGFNDLFDIEYKTMELFEGYPITHDKVSICNSIGSVGNGFSYVKLKPFQFNREESKQDIFIEKPLSIKEASELMPDET